MSGNLPQVNKVHSVLEHLSLVGGFSIEALAGAAVIDSTYGNFVAFDPDGAHRDVTLPAEATSKGRWYFIANRANAAENLVIKNDGGDTICTANQNEAAIVYCGDALAWTLFCMVTIAIS